MERKTLIVYYSRKGNTKILANTMANKMACDIEEIIDTKNRKGFWGYLSAIIDSSKQNLTQIKSMTKHPGAYDKIIIGTPIRNGTITPAVREYISKYSQALPAKIAFFCTQSSDNYRLAFQEMAEMTGKTPLSTLSIKNKKIKDNNYQKELANFINEVS